MNGKEGFSPPSTLPAILSLFTSTGTLICCALPAVLVTFGAGAVMAGLIETVPQITWFGTNRKIVFATAGILLLASGLWQLHARSLPCPADRQKADACRQARRFGALIWMISAGLFAIGFFFAFLAPGLLR